MTPVGKYQEAPLYNHAAVRQEASSDMNRQQATDSKQRSRSDIGQKLPKEDNEIA